MASKSTVLNYSIILVFDGTANTVFAEDPTMEGTAKHLKKQTSGISSWRNDKLEKHSAIRCISKWK